jgi:hypothetical protein
MEAKSRILSRVRRALKDWPKALLPEHPHATSPQDPLDLFLKRLGENGAEGYRVPRAEALAFLKDLLQGFPGAAFGKGVPPELRLPLPALPPEEAPLGDLLGPLRRGGNRNGGPLGRRRPPGPAPPPHPPGPPGGGEDLPHPVGGPFGPRPLAQRPRPPLWPLQERGHRPGDGEGRPRTREAGGGGPHLIRTPRDPILADGVTGSSYQRLS